MIKLFLGKKDKEGKPLFCDTFIGYSHDIKRAAEFAQSWTDSISDFNVFLYNDTENELLELTKLNNQDLLKFEDLIINLRLNLIRMLPKINPVYGNGVYSFEKFENKNNRITGYELVKYHEDKRTCAPFSYKDEKAVIANILNLSEYFEFFKITDTFTIPKKKEEVSLEDATKILFASPKANIPLDEIPSIYPYNENISWDNMSENDAWLLSDDDRTVFWKLHRILPQELEKRVKNNTNNIVMIPENGYIGAAGIRTISLSYHFGDWVWVYNNNLNSNNEGKCIQAELDKWMKSSLSAYSKPNPLISFYYAEKITKEEAESYCQKKEQNYYYEFLCEPMDIHWAIKSAKPITDMVDFLFKDKERKLAVAKCYLDFAYTKELSEIEAIEKFGSFDKKYCFNFKENEFYIKKEKYYYSIVSLKHSQINLESEQYFPDYYIGHNDKNLVNPIYDELVEVLVDKGLIKKEWMIDFRGMLTVVKEINKKNYDLLTKEKTIPEKIDAALIVLPHNNGLTRNEISELLKIIDSEEVYPLNIEGEYESAIGFISKETFGKKMNYNADGLKMDIEFVLNTAEFENVNNTYSHHGEPIAFQIFYRKE